MKIAHFTDSFLPKVDGMVFAVDELSKRMADENEVRLFVPAYSRKGKKQKKGKVIVERYPSLEVPTYKGLHMALPNFIKLFGEVKNFNPDVIHVHSPGTMGLNGVIIARRLGKPIVGTYHTLVSEMLMYVFPKLGWGDEFKSAISRLWKELVGEGVGNGFIKGFSEGLDWIRESGRKGEKKEAVLKRITWFLVNKFFNYCDIVIAPSMVIKKELIKRGMTNDVEVVSNGIDVKLFRAKNEYKSKYRVLHVGRLGYEKNVDEVVKAFFLVQKKFPQAKLTLVGDGPARKDLEKLARELAIEKKIEFSGWKERSKLGEVYRENSLFVTASAMETQGLVVLEAMASGIPVVGVNKYAVAEVVKSGKNGYLVRQYDTEGMARSIEQILGDLELEENLGRGARRTAESHDVNETVKTVREIYDRAIEMRRGREMYVRPIG